MKQIINKQGGSILIKVLFILSVKKTCRITEILNFCKVKEKEKEKEKIICEDILGHFRKLTKI